MIDHTVAKDCRLNSKRVGFRHFLCIWQYMQRVNGAGSVEVNKCIVPQW